MLLLVIATEKWVALNVSFALVSMLIISNGAFISNYVNPNTLWLLCLGVRSVLDLLLCREYYANVLKGNYLYKNLNK